jgi:hypothetical protein
MIQNSGMKGAVVQSSRGLTCVWRTGIAFSNRSDPDGRRIRGEVEYQLTDKDMRQVERQTLSAKR